ncbi:ribonuclease H-like domain-containing protein [Tanacetum coccineum]
MRLKSSSLALPMDSSSPMVLMAQSGTNRRPSTLQVKSWKSYFNFAKGSCCFGSECKYVHDYNAKPVPNTNPRLENTVTTDDFLVKLLDKLGLSCTPSTVSPNVAQTIPTANIVYPTPGPNLVHQADPTVSPPPGFTFLSLGNSSQQIGLAPPSFGSVQQQAPVHGVGSAQIFTGASSHLNASLTSLSNVFNTCIYPSIVVGDGHSIPVTNTGHSILPIPFRPLHINNVLITLNIVKNLIYVRQFVRDNNCTIEFDMFGFSVKDFVTRRVLLRCDSTGDLYPVTAPSPIPHAFLVSQHVWHQCLGHLGSEVLRRLVSSNFISCNKEKPPVLCHACQLGKHTRLSFVSSDTLISSRFDIVHSDV